MRFEKLFLNVILTLFLTLSLSAGAFANKKINSIYISRVGASNGSEFIQIFNSGEDVNFNDLSVKIGKKQTNLAQFKKGIFKSKSYILISQNISNSDFIFLKNSISEKTQIGLYLDGELQDYVCSMVCSDGFLKNSTDIRGDNILVSKYENDAKLNSNDIKNNYEFSLQPLSSELLSGGFLSKDEKNDANSSNEDSILISPKEDITPPANINPNIKQDAPKPKNKDNCNFLQINEVLNNSESQFIEIKNNSDNDITINNCAIEVRSGISKNLSKLILENQEIKANDFIVVKIIDNVLKLSKNTINHITILDSSNNEIDIADLPANSKKDASWIKDETGDWKQTFEVTEGSRNILNICKKGYELNNEGKCFKEEKIEDLKKCDESYVLNEKTSRCNKVHIDIEKECNQGYYLNPRTNRCNKIITREMEQQAPCRSGYIRNPETNHCRKNTGVVAKKTSLTICKEGYERNPTTNRCRKIKAEVAEIKPCKEGYERNLETNRCRKIVSNNGAKDSIQNIENEEKESNFTGWWAIILIILLVLAIVIFEFRKEILKVIRKFKK